MYSLVSTECGWKCSLNSKRNVQELVITLAQQIEDSQLHVLCDSQFYGIMTDEGTDVSITKQLVLYMADTSLKWVSHAVLFYVLLISLMEQLSALKKPFEPI